jgi:mRNA interferase RelE/StbE
VSRYAVYVLPNAWQELKALPGSMRQRVKRAIDELADEPRPAHSRQLDVPGLTVELRRLRLERWRIVYAISEADRAIDVLAARKRPPYDYGDLADLLEQLEQGDV